MVPHHTCNQVLQGLQPSAASPTSSTPSPSFDSSRIGFPAPSQTRWACLYLRAFALAVPSDLNVHPPPARHILCLTHSFTSGTSWCRCHLTWQPSLMPLKQEGKCCLVQSQLGNVCIRGFTLFTTLCMSQTFSDGLFPAAGLGSSPVFRVTVSVQQSPDPVQGEWILGWKMSVEGRATTLSHEVGSDRTLQCHCQVRGSEAMSCLCL